MQMRVLQRHILVYYSADKNTNSLAWTISAISEENTNKAELISQKAKWTFQGSVDHSKISRVPRFLLYMYFSYFFSLGFLTLLKETFEYFSKFCPKKGKKVPGKLGTGARLSTFLGRTVVPWGPTVH